MNCAFDSNVFVQDSRKGWPECGCNGARRLVILATPPLVILSEAKDDIGEIRMILDGQFVSPRLMR